MSSALTGVNVQSSIQEPLEVDISMHREIREHAFKYFDSSDCPSGSVMFFEGEKTLERHETDNEPLIRQHSFFAYLFGVKEADCYAAIDIDSHKSVLFIPRLPAEYAIWFGQIFPPEHFQKMYGVDECMYTDEMEKFFSERVSGKVYLLNGVNTDSGHRVKQAHFDGLEKFTLDTSSKLWDALVEARTVKTPKEIDLMARINRLSSEAHMAVMAATPSAKVESQLEAVFRFWCQFHGGARLPAYTPIVGSGKNAATLHYGHAGAPNDRKFEDGDIVLNDMGCELHFYGSDITCSYPVNGKFTEQQRNIYEAVLAVQHAVMDNVKAGVEYKDMQTLAYRVICERLTAIGILTGNIDEMMEANIGALFMPHGLGHMIGVDTHDVGGFTPEYKRDTRMGHKSLRCPRKLVENNVITIEPGIYFIDCTLNDALKDESRARFFVQSELAKYRNFGGVRLEDNVVITADGIKNLTTVPRTVEDVEAVCSGQKSSVDELTLFHV